MLGINWADCIVLLVIGLSMLTGFVRGLVKESIALSVWIAAFWLAFTCSQYVIPWLAPYLQDKTVRSIVAFMLVLFATLIAGAILNILIGLVLHRSGLSPIDRLLGMIFGLVRGILIVSLIMLVLSLTGISDASLRKNTRLYATFDPLVTWLHSFVPSFIHKMKVLDNMESAIDKVHAP